MTKCLKKFQDTADSYCALGFAEVYPTEAVPGIPSIRH